MMNFGRYVNYQLQYRYIILLPGVLYMQGLQYIVTVCFKTRILLNILLIKLNKIVILIMTHQYMPGFGLFSSVYDVSFAI